MIKRLIKSLVILICCVLVSLASSAQSIPANLDINQLSDQQIIQLINNYNLSGLSEAELVMKAKERGLSDSQIEQLRQRIAQLPADAMKGAGNKPSSNTEIDARGRNTSQVVRPFREKKPGEPEIFGEELFSNKNLTFEPNLRIATPKNYLIGADDQIQIEVFGFSEKTVKLIVSPEGYIRYPNLGPIKVGGLSIEEAEARIKKELSKLYTGINSGNTFVKVTLGDIKSIRVTLIGEVQQPGTYTLPSLATIANALYVSGGPNKNGSFRNIQLIRDGKPAVTFDLYDFLINGSLKNNIILQHDDIIKVNPFSSRVELQGAVKRPALYEVKPGESLSTILNFAGGFADIAYKEKIRVRRFGVKEREVLTVEAKNIKSFIPLSGDKYFIDSLSNTYSNRVVIHGAVYHQGYYDLNSHSTLKNLLDAAILKENAFKERGLIRRLREDLTQEMLAFNIKEIIEGRSNINLQREDSIMIYSIENTREQFTVSINGEVNVPAEYPFAQKMKIQDLILMAGGLKEGASTRKIEVARRIRKEGEAKDSISYAVIYDFEIKKDLSGNYAYDDFSLEPYDIVSVRKIPEYRNQIKVYIKGEVQYPGEYILNGGQETILELITRAGGLKPSAYSEGGILFRNTFAIYADSALMRNKLRNMQIASKDSTITLDSLSTLLKEDKKIVGVKIGEVLKNPKSKFNIKLEEGDIIDIPKKLETAQTFGAVYVPKKVVVAENTSFKDLIDESGGYLPNAAKRSAYVVYANGQIKRVKKFLFFTTYPKIKPGAEIYIPERSKSKGLSAQELIGISSGLASLATIFLVIRTL